MFRALFFCRSRVHTLRTQHLSQAIGNRICKRKQVFAT